MHGARISKPRSRPSDGPLITLAAIACAVALVACGSSGPSSAAASGGPGSAHPTAHAKSQMLHVSQCMRRHGVSAFPDPTFTLPSSPNGYRQVIDRGGVVVAIPNTINAASPAFKQAATACGFGH